MVGKRWVQLVTGVAERVAQHRGAPDVVANGVMGVAVEPEAWLSLDEHLGAIGLVNFVITVDVEDRYPRGAASVL